VSTDDAITGLNDLLQLDHDAVGAYEVAIDNLQNRDDALQIEGFKLDHQRHIRELNDLIQELGGIPTNEPHPTAPLKQALQKIAGVAGDDALLLAWRSNEQRTMSAYDGYAQKAQTWPPAVKRLIDQNALDEERHYRWAVDRLANAPASGMHVSSQLRERASRAQVMGDDLRILLAHEIGTRPGRSLAAIFVAGFVFGRLLR
jgi:hypothetical protein